MNYQDSGCVIFQDQIKPADVSVKIEADNTSFMEKKSFNKLTVLLNIICKKYSLI